MKLATGLCAALVLCLACHEQQPSYESASASASAPPRLDTAKVVDLTYAFDENTVYWPTSPSSFQLEKLAYGRTDAGFFYSANAFATPEHGGTHLDAPIHFSAGRWTADEIPVERLIGPAVVIDVSGQAQEDPDYLLTEGDVTSWERVHGRIPEGSIVLLRTGWGRYWPDTEAYLGDDTPGDASNLHFPAYGRDAAHLLVDDREVAVLGVDTASIDHGPSTDFWVHRIANQSNVPGLENVANLDLLPPTGAWVIALPMKIAGGSGGPVRIVALMPEDSGDP
jgi:kynurenine formamidase